jgi:hypothetical protein
MLQPFFFLTHNLFKSFFLYNPPQSRIPVLPRQHFGKGSGVSAKIVGGWRDDVSFGYKTSPPAELFSWPDPFSKCWEPRRGAASGLLFFGYFLFAEAKESD